MNRKCMMCKKHLFEKDDECIALSKQYLEECKDAGIEPCNTCTFFKTHKDYLEKRNELMNKGHVVYRSDVSYYFLDYLKGDF